MPDELVPPKPDVKHGHLPTHFKEYVHQVSDAMLFALERRHLEYLDIASLPNVDLLEDPEEVDIKFLKVGQIGHGAVVERSLDILNMQNILGSFRHGSHSFVLGLRATGVDTSLYLGARLLKNPHGRWNPANDFVENLRRTVEGNLPGTRFKSYPNAEGEEPDTHTVICPEEDISKEIRGPLNDFKNLAALTGIPSLRGNREEQFAQSLDRLTQALQGQDYMMLIIAEPLREDHVSEVMANCLRLNSEVHSWVRISTSYSQAIAESSARTQGTGTTTSDATGRTTGSTSSQAKTMQPAVVSGGLIGAGVALMLSAVPGLGTAALAVSNMASSIVTGKSGSISDTISENAATSQTRTWGEQLTRSLTESSSETNTASMNVEYLNKTAEYCEKVMDGYIQRLQRGKNLGMWNVGVYFLANDPSTFAQGQAQLRSLYSGRESFYEPMRTVNLSLNQNVRRNVINVLSTFSNPEISLMDSSTGEPLRHPLGKLHRSLSTPLNTEELALLMNLPRREVPGLKLELVADFGVNPRPFDTTAGIEVGRVVSSGAQLDIPVGVEASDFTRHIFITGITGSGKTNTCFSLLKAVSQRKIPTLIIEPAKGEYRNLIGDPDLPDLRVYTAGDYNTSPFCINPFQFVPGMNLITHLDNLRAIFNAAFPMYASMPYMLEEAMVLCYQDYGWNLIDSTNAQFAGFTMEEVVENWRRGVYDYRYTRYLPTLEDLYQRIEKVVLSQGYAQELTSNFIGALKARIGSLLRGSKGQMFNQRRGIGYEELFEKPTVLELRSLGDDDEKCFLMALLLVQLYEYREQTYRWANRPGLQHLTVLEESHRLLGQAPSVVATGEVANPRGKAVETFANMLAEIREYGEGFLIIDQTPAKLIPDVVKNTSTKILHRLTARDDRDTMGDAMGMTEEQKQMVPRMRVGDAIFHSQDQDKPVWMKVPPVKGDRMERKTNEQVKAYMEPIRQEREQVQAEEERTWQEAENLAILKLLQEKQQRR